MYLDQDSGRSFDCGDDGGLIVLPAIEFEGAADIGIGDFPLFEVTSVASRQRMYRITICG